MKNVYCKISFCLMSLLWCSISPGWAQVASTSLPGQETWEEVYDPLHARSGNSALRLVPEKNQSSVFLTDFIPVKAGDSFSVEVYGHYSKEKKNGLALKKPLSLAFLALASRFTAAKPSTKEGHSITPATTALPLLATGAVLAAKTLKSQRGVPKAYVSLLQYDMEGHYLGQVTHPLSKEAQDNWQQLKLSLPNQKAGFVRVQLTNESKQPVWFDDLAVKSTKSTDAMRKGLPMGPTPMMATSSGGGKAQGSGDDSDEDQQIDEGDEGGSEEDGGGVWYPGGGWGGMDGGGGGGGGSGPVDYVPGTGGGGGGGGSSTTLVDISTNFTTPCFNTVMSNLNAYNVKSDIIDILKNVFNVNDDINLFFEEDPTLPANLDGVTNTSRSGALNVTISLNTTVLKNSSQEYIAATILHEAVHAYFEYLNRVNPAQAQLQFPIFYNILPSSGGQHTVMADSYVAKIKEGILSAYPAFPADVAESIAWGGLQNTIGWQVRSANPAWVTKVTTDNQNERTAKTGGASKGTVCP